VLWEEEGDKNHKGRKTLTLIKMPPENDEGTYHCEHHKLPTGSESDLLDVVCADDSVLLLMQSKTDI
jgi:hypothetical protein